MGRYHPSNTGNKPSVSETLRAAEEDHYLDCPDAEIRLRAAALVLDFLLVALAVSGLQSVCAAIQAHLGHLEPPGPEKMATLWESFKIFLSLHSTTLATYIYISLRLAFLYFYFIWSIVFAGGSPGKLLMGLRVVLCRTGGFPNFSTVFFRESLKVSSLLCAFLGAFYYLLSKEKVSLHDFVCKTSVKRVHGRL